MNKLRNHHENPVDVVLLGLTGTLLPAFHATGHTPNVITTYSFAAGLVAVAALWYGHVGTFVVAYAVSYTFDCMDGQMARRYRMTSEFGDWYDHVTDVLVMVLLAVVIGVRRWRYVSAAEVLTFVALLLLLGVHMGCQQRHRPRPSTEEDAEEAETLDDLQVLCHHREWIRWTRYFGSGTFVVALLLYVMCAFRDHADAAGRGESKSPATWTVPSAR